MSYGNIPFGIADAFLLPEGGGAGADLPIIRSLDVNMTSDSTDLTGDDTTVAVHTFNTHAEGSIEAGGISPAAIAIMIGGTAAVTGTTPNAKTTIVFDETTRGAYFKLEAQIIDDTGEGDLHVIVWRAKITTGPSWTFQGGEYTLTTADYTGVADPNNANKIVSMVFNETATAIDTSP
jgi:hypothetical protein